MTSRRCEVLVAIQQALLGEVSARLRAVTVSYDDNNIHLDCYYHGEILDADREAMSCVETELMASFPESHSVTHSVQRRDCPHSIPKEMTWVFLRKEDIE